MNTIDPRLADWLARSQENAALGRDAERCRLAAIEMAAQASTDLSTWERNHASLERERRSILSA